MRARKFRPAPKFWYRPRPTGTALLLAPVGALYGIGHSLRRALAKPWRSPARVVCVGNLVAGGAGKTPVALDIGARLIAQGSNVHFLSRGYGGNLEGPVEVDPDRHSAAEVGDEPLELAEVAPVWVSADRRAGAEAAIAAGSDLIVMDDGFQNFDIEKDRAVLVVDGAAGFGNRLGIPAGPLREGISGGLKRADAVVILGDDLHDVEADIARLGSAAPNIFRADLVAGPEGDGFAAARVIAFAGIGRPAKFFATLAETGCTIVETHAFPDHHAYTEDDVAEMTARAREAGGIAVTTAKDAARIPGYAAKGIRVLSVHLEWRAGSDADALVSLLAHPGERPS